MDVGRARVGGSQRHLLVLRQSELCPAVRFAVGAVCGYEAVAILGHGRIPTVSTLCGRYRMLVPLIVGGLTAHLLLPRRKVTA